MAGNSWNWFSLYSGYVEGVRNTSCASTGRNCTSFTIPAMEEVKTIYTIFVTYKDSSSATFFEVKSWDIINYPEFIYLQHKSGKKKLINKNVIKAITIEGGQS